MKAKEYYAKYSVALLNEERRKKALKDLTDEMLEEMQELMKARNICRKSAFKAIVEEMNGKWNALARMFDPPLLIKDAFKEFIYKVVLEKELIEG